jgi:cytochrome c biogenesis protein CcmG/thiol:disulfide interchange protein DsbE
MSSTRNPRTTGPAPSGPNVKVVVIAIGLVVALAAITAVLVSGGDDDETVGSGAGEEEVALENYGAVVVSGDPLPPLPDGEDDPAIGTRAPAITSEQPGSTVEVVPGDGEPMLILFLAHWCPHCQAELPKYVELAEQGALDGLRTVAVATSTTPERPNYPPSAWLDEEGWAGDRFYDDRESTAAAAYGLTSFPFAVFVDADGNVVDRFSGADRSSGAAPDERVLAAIDAAT